MPIPDSLRTMFHSGCPNRFRHAILIEWTARQAVVQDDRFALVYGFAGTSTNDLLDFTVAGQPVVGRGLEINEFDKSTCLLTVTWNYSDAYGFFAQLQWLRRGQV